MIEELDRGELPIQSVYQRDQDCTTTVPVNLKLFNLPKEDRENLTIIDNARGVVEPWYNEDMKYYLGILKEEGDNCPWLKGYETFRDEWVLSGKQNGNGFLDLLWTEGKEEHVIKLCSTPVFLYNQHNKMGQFYTPEINRENRLLELMYRNITDSEILFMNPDKMRLYGKETDLAQIHEERGIAEVQASAFCSGYYNNMAKTLLLRDFAVFYLNGLLAKV